MNPSHKLLSKLSSHRWLRLNSSNSLPANINSSSRRLRLWSLAWWRLKMRRRKTSKYWSDLTRTNFYLTSFLPPIDSYLSKLSTWKTKENAGASSMESSSRRPRPRLFPNCKLWFKTLDKLANRLIRLSWLLNKNRWNLSNNTLQSCKPLRSVIMHRLPSRRPVQHLAVVCSSEQRNFQELHFFTNFSNRATKISIL